MQGPVTVASQAFGRLRLEYARVYSYLCKGLSISCNASTTNSDLTPLTPTADTLIRENLDQLQQDVFRLQTMARKEIPSRRQEAHV